MRIGILGVAHVHSDQYVEHLRHAGADVVGAYDADPDRGASWGKLHDVRYGGSLDALLAKELSGVVICSETSRHPELTVAAARAGLAILCEKPLATTEAGARMMVKACSEAGVPLMTAFPTRLHPAVREARRIVVAGGLGRLKALSGTNQSVMPMRERSWFADPAWGGGGAMMDHIVHLADLFCWMTNRRPLRVYGIANRLVHALVVPVETAGLVMLDFPDGVFGSIDCSWNRPLEYPTWGGMGFSVIGEEGTLTVDPFRQRLTAYGGGRQLEWIPWGVDTNQLLIEEFLQGIGDGRTPSITGTDGLVATLVALAALESAASGQPVTMSRIQEEGS